MPVSTTATEQYFRLASQQQVLYAYWLSAGDVARARLAIDVANWYYQQLGIPYYIPTDLPGYAPNPTTPASAVAIAASLPDVSATATVADAGSGGSVGSGGSSGGGLQAHDVGGGASFDDSSSLAAYCAYYPDDPICYGQGFTFGGGGDNNPPPIYISDPTTIIINQDGLTLGDVTSRISGALASAAAAIATAVDTALASAIKGIQHALNAIGNELAAVFHLLARLAGYILQFLKGLLLGVIHGLVAAVDAIGKMLKDVFANGLMPALRALQKARDYLIKIYERFLRPLLIVLQDLRKVLAILKVFHIGFATKLDNVLADIQSKISTPLLYLLRYTNAIANYINLILDARLFLQRPLFLASLNAYKGSSVTLALNAMKGTPDPATIARLQAFPPPTEPAQSADALHQLLDTGHGPYASDVAIYQVQLDDILTGGL